MHRETEQIVFMPARIENPRDAERRQTMQDFLLRDWQPHCYDPGGSGGACLEWILDRADVSNGQKS